VLVGLLGVARSVERQVLFVLSYSRVFLSVFVMHCSVALIYPKYQNFVSISIWRIVWPADISKFLMYRYQSFDVSSCRIFISFIHSHLGWTVTDQVSVSEVEVV